MRSTPATAKSLWQFHRRRPHRFLAHPAQGLGAVRLRRRLGLLPAGRVTARSPGAISPLRTTADSSPSSNSNRSGRCTAACWCTTMSVYCLAGRNMFFDGGLRLALLTRRPAANCPQACWTRTTPKPGKPADPDREEVHAGRQCRPVLLQREEHLHADPEVRSRRQAHQRRPHPAGQGTPDMAGDDHLFCQTGFLDTIGSTAPTGSTATTAARAGAPMPDPGKPTPPAASWPSTTSGPTASAPTRSATCCIHARPTCSTPRTSNPRRQATAHRKNGERESKRKTARQPQIERPQRRMWQAGLAPTAGQRHGTRRQDALRRRAARPGRRKQGLRFPPRCRRRRSTVNSATRRKHGTANTAAFLQAVSAETGNKLADHKLDTYPVFDGLIAAEGRLFMSMLDGTVRCYRSCVADESCGGNIRIPLSHVPEY